MPNAPWQRLVSGLGSTVLTRPVFTCALFACATFAGTVLPAHAAEHVSLSNGFALVCDHRVADGDKTRLYLTSAGDSGFVEVTTADIVSIEPITLPTPAEQAADAPATHSAETPNTNPRHAAAQPKLTAADLHELLAAAGTARNLDVDLLASVIHAESGGRPHAVSRTGAQGLMQLMPRTAADLGVTDSFQPDQNINGGTAYLDALLVRYHDDLALALAAYNAGPRAVDRYRGIPPYRETRAYVARIIHEFNQRKLAEESTARRSSAALRASDTAALRPLHGPGSAASRASRAPSE